MTQERIRQDQGFPTSTQVPGALNPEPVREPWDPRREPHGAPMPWEENKPKNEDEEPKGEDQAPTKG